MNNSITLIHAAKGKLRREACLRECANGGKCANVQMCKCANEGECANVQMCKCANGRILLLRWWLMLLMCECLVNVRMCECLVNVQMCECANGGRKTQLYKGDNLHICTFSHLHISQAFAHFPSIRALHCGKFAYRFVPKGRSLCQMQCFGWGLCYVPDGSVLATHKVLGNGTL